MGNSINAQNWFLKPSFSDPRHVNNFDNSIKLMIIHTFVAKLFCKGKDKSVFSKTFAHVHGCLRLDPSYLLVYES